jgi:hypothetical protein
MEFGMLVGSLILNTLPFGNFFHISTDFELIKIFYEN